MAFQGGCNASEDPFPLYTHVVLVIDSMYDTYKRYWKRGVRIKDVGWHVQGRHSERHSHSFLGQNPGSLDDWNWPMDESLENRDRKSVV